MWHPHLPDTPALKKRMTECQVAPTETVWSHCLKCTVSVGWIAGGKNGDFPIGTMVGVSGHISLALYVLAMTLGPRKRRLDTLYKYSIIRKAAKEKVKVMQIRFRNFTAGYLTVNVTRKYLMLRTSRKGQ